MTTKITSDIQQIELARERQSAQKAREFAHECLVSWGCTAIEDDVSLALSELVTNAVVHAESATTVTMVNMGNCVQLRVSDTEPDLPQRRDPSSEDTGGRGIVLIEAVSSDWGIEQEPPGKVVWLDISKL